MIELAFSVNFAENICQILFGGFVIDCKLGRILFVVRAEKESLA